MECVQAKGNQPVLNNFYLERQILFPQNKYLPGGKFLGLMDDFKMTMTKIVAKAAPTVNKVNISFNSRRKESFS